MLEENLWLRHFIWQFFFFILADDVEADIPKQKPALTNEQLVDEVSSLKRRNKALTMQVLCFTGHIKKKYENSQRFLHPTV